MTKIDPFETASFSFNQLYHHIPVSIPISSGGDSKATYQDILLSPLQDKLQIFLSIPVPSLNPLARKNPSEKLGACSIGCSQVAIGLLIFMSSFSPRMSILFDPEH